MKKTLLKLLLIAALVLAPFSIVKADKKEKEEINNKVTIHLFYASWCGYCHDFIEYFSTRYEEYSDRFEIKAYLISTLSEDGKSRVSIPENVLIMQAVNEHFETDNAGNPLKGGIPLIIIGDSFVQSGFGSDGSQIISVALEENKNKNYTDTVAKIIQDKNFNTSKVTDFKTVVDSILNKSSEEETGGKYDTYIIIGIFVVLIGGFAGLVIAGKKK